MKQNLSYVKKSNKMFYKYLKYKKSNYRKL